MSEEPSTRGGSTASRLAKVNQVDDELEAINLVVAALGSLAPEARRRAVEYVLRRFSIIDLQLPLPFGTVPGSTSNLPPRAGEAALLPQRPSGAIKDIRTLKELKKPKSANEMAALVAFYLSELASGADRKEEITSSDIERYFKAAGFSLPADANFTLVNAKNAGYLDNASRGLYKLNPVGYNLVAHRMEDRSAKEKRPSRGRKSQPRDSSRKRGKVARGRK